MLRYAVLAAVLLAATPVLADVRMTLDNRASVAVIAINSFPVDENGEGVEDNLGGLAVDEVAPGTKSEFQLDGNCAITRFFVRLAGQTGDDLELDVNTCKSRTIVVSD